MTRPEEYSVIQDVEKLLADDGFDGIGEAVPGIFNEAMRLERQNTLESAHTNESKHVEAMPMDTNRRPSRPASVR